MVVVAGVGLLLLSLALNQLPITGSPPAWAVEQGAETGHHAFEHQGAPFIYYVDWLLLLITLSIVWFKVKAQLKQPVEEAEEHHAPLTGAGIPVFLIGLVSFIFLTESLSAVAHYHELVRVGLVHLLIKLAAGVLLMLYGLSFIHEH